MPTLDDRTVATAPPEEVWKILYDPSRFPEWWDGLESVDTDAEKGDFTRFSDGYPDYPMPQELETNRSDGRVRVSCLVSDIHFEWRLEAMDSENGTAISVHVEIPEEEAHRLDTQRGVMERSLKNLAELAAAA
jgi:uncharacterized protein YndB with AHSA1/START domain